MTDPRLQEDDDYDQMVEERKKKEGFTFDPDAEPEEPAEAGHGSHEPYQGTSDGYIQAPRASRIAPAAAGPRGAKDFTVKPSGPPGLPI